MAGRDAQVLDLAGRVVRITSPDKVLFSERGETKLDLVRYQAVRELRRVTVGKPTPIQRSSRHPHSDTAARAPTTADPLPR